MNSLLVHRIKASHSLRLAILFFVAACLLVGTASQAQAAKPNIVFILVDDMGYGDPGCFNPESKIPTPNIDGLAAAGMRFTDAHASGPLCHMSRYGLMTGRYPFRTDVGKWPKQALIGPNEVTLPSLLRDQGYDTAMVGKWHLGFNEKGYDKPLKGGPVDVGFDSFFGIRASTDIPPYFYIRNDQAVDPPTVPIEARSTAGWSPIQGAFSRAGKIAPDLKLKDVLPKFTAEACQVIRSHAGNEKPLMLYLAYPAPHTPWLPSKQFASKSGAGLYGDFAMMVDDQIGQVLKTLDDTGLSQDTLVVFTSDNGPVWYEQDVQRFNHDSSGGLRGMKADAWECGHRMPMVIRWPGVVKAGASSNRLVSFVDFLATLDELVEANIYRNAEAMANDVGPDSFSFLSELTGKPSNAPKRQSLALRSGRRHMTIRRGSWKWIEGLGSGGFSKSPKPSKTDPKANIDRLSSIGQLYNLEADLGETKNVADQHARLVTELRELVHQIEHNPRSR
ncbi:Arylsulfatase precursor [Stieleria bergensis]|uniref:Arylsulfatase n=1 Tax=Stieleria bergensis TaxID=2528025 RepID=A0A517SR18_9BACT|nr:Arylsulfatase precursor [Planctomycetes bacterium SV_7m_r]